MARRSNNSPRGSRQSGNAQGKEQHHPKKMSRRETRQYFGEALLQEDERNKSFDNDWNLDWFKPQNLQVDCVENFESSVFNIVDAPSGCGKTSTALWWALNQLRLNNYSQLIFLKNPTEAGDDKIGFLSGDKEDKLEAHFNTTKHIFFEFMSKGKFESDVGKGKIKLEIPNYTLGATFRNAIVIIDETQTMSRETVKLLTERCGENTTYIILGDSKQRYSVSNRSDGFADFISRTTKEYQGIRISNNEEFVSYVKMNRNDNMRSSGSAYINYIYEEL